MGFPIVYNGVILPKLLITFLSVLGFIRFLILTILRPLGLTGYLEPDVILSDRSGSSPSTRPGTMYYSLKRVLLPVVKFSEVAGVETPEICAVCLREFEGQEEIRRLRNCKHIFHRWCVDRWMEHDRMTCPLCRTSLHKSLFNSSLLLTHRLFFDSSLTSAHLLSSDIGGHHRARKDARRWRDERVAPSPTSISFSNDIMTVANRLLLWCAQMRGHNFDGLLLFGPVSQFLLTKCPTCRIDLTWVDSQLAGTLVEGRSQLAGTLVEGSLVGGRSQLVGTRLWEDMAGQYETFAEQEELPLVEIRIYHPFCPSLPCAESAENYSRQHRDKTMKNISPPQT
ncbi:hypothetical protein V2J09_014649 [Rumex salicifolius]